VTNYKRRVYTFDPFGIGGTHCKRQATLWVLLGAPSGLFVGVILVVEVGFLGERGVDS
jgi:hypothetical protein